MTKRFLFTSDAVTDGHPDRLCDSISDAVVDRFLLQDPYCRIVAECALSKNVLFLAARFATEATIDIPDVARGVLHDAGYHKDDFDASHCSVLTSLILMDDQVYPRLEEKDLDDHDLDLLGVRSQASLFGYACNQTAELMPLPISLARRLAVAFNQARRRKDVDALSPDCTIQVGVEYEAGVPVRIASITVIAGTVATRPLSSLALRELMIQEVMGPLLKDDPIPMDSGTEILVNPDGASPKSGPRFHSGMTGRKTASDTYGAYARHSGSALSGKDPSRIDRVGAYMARYAAKNVVAAGLAQQCEVQLSYAIGQAAPASLAVQTFGSGILGDEVIRERLLDLFDFRLGAIIRDFNLRHLPALHREGFYRWLPATGHMGESRLALPWERTDRSSLLR